MSASRLLKVITGGAAALLICLYHFWAGWGLSRIGILPVALSLASIILLRSLMSPSRKNFGFAAIALVLSALSAILDAEEPMLFYPVAVNGFLLWLFGTSLSSTPIVEKFARLRTPDLPPEGVRWCRGVTKVWCGFFVLNGSVALATVLERVRELCPHLHPLCGGVSAPQNPHATRRPKGIARTPTDFYLEDALFRSFRSCRSLPRGSCFASSSMSSASCIA